MWINNGKNIANIYAIENIYLLKTKDSESRQLFKLRKDIYDIFLCNEKGDQTINL